MLPDYRKDLTFMDECEACLPEIRNGRINQLADGDKIWCEICGCAIPTRQYWFILDQRAGQRRNQDAAKRKKPIEAPPGQMQMF